MDYDEIDEEGTKEAFHNQYSSATARKSLDLVIKDLKRGDAGHNDAILILKDATDQYVMNDDVARPNGCQLI